MHIVFISDIHANLPVFQAVWHDKKKHQYDNFFCLGDVVNFAGWDNEVIDFLRKHNIPCIQGNHDEGIGYGHMDFNYSSKTLAQKEFGVASIAHINSTIRADNRNYLKSLPFSIKLDFRYPFHSVRVTMMHGSPLSNKDYILPDNSEEQWKCLMKQMQTYWL